MINYNMGKIYKIEAMNGIDEDIYICSTTIKTTKSKEGDTPTKL